MTMDTFIKRIEGYYGAQYRPGQRPYIEQYLSPREGQPLDHLFALTLKTFSSQYGKAPDIAVFESIRGDVIKSLEQSTDLLALPPASEIPTEEEREEIAKGLEQFNQRFGTWLGSEIPPNGWGQKPEDA